VLFWPALPVDVPPFVALLDVPPPTDVVEDGWGAGGLVALPPCGEDAGGVLVELPAPPIAFPSTPFQLFIVSSPGMARGEGRPCAAAGLAGVILGIAPGLAPGTGGAIGGAGIP